MQDRLSASIDWCRRRRYRGVDRIAHRRAAAERSVRCVRVGGGRNGLRDVYLRGVSLLVCHVVDSP